MQDYASPDSLVFGVARTTVQRARSVGEVVRAKTVSGRAVHGLLHWRIMKMRVQEFYARAHGRAGIHTKRRLP